MGRSYLSDVNNTIAGSISDVFYCDPMISTGIQWSLQIEKQSLLEYVNPKEFYLQLDLCRSKINLDTHKLGNSRLSGLWCQILNLHDPSNGRVDAAHMITRWALLVYVLILFQMRLECSFQISGNARIIVILGRSNGLVREFRIVFSHSCLCRKNS